MWEECYVTTRLSIEEETNRNTIFPCVFGKQHRRYGLKRQPVCRVTGESGGAQVLFKGEICFLKELHLTVRAQPEDMAVTRVCGCWWRRCPIGTGNQI